MTWGATNQDYTENQGYGVATNFSFIYLIKNGWDFTKFCGLLRIYELYLGSIQQLRGPNFTQFWSNRILSEPIWSYLIWSCKIRLSSPMKIKVYPFTTSIWRIFRKKTFQFWREIWIQVVVILLQLYTLINIASIWRIFSWSWICTRFFYFIF